MTQILAITDTADGHVPFVQEHLPSLIVLEPYTGLLTCETRSERVVAFYGEHELTAVCAVWYRRGRFEPPNVQREARERTRKAAAMHMGTLRSRFPSARWVSNPYAVDRADDDRALQLETAARAGLRIPDTIFTADEDRAREFLERHQRTVIKPLRSGWHDDDAFRDAIQAESAEILEGGSRPAAVKRTVTRLVHRGRSLDLRGLHLEPWTFQQAIDPVADVRVTVVGEQVFAASITDPGDGEHLSIRDWRINHAYGRTRFEPCELPDSVHKACIAMRRELGLESAIFEFVRDGHGDLWYIEANANGQWAFIEHDTGLPIGRALAQRLVETTATSSRG